MMSTLDGCVTIKAMTEQAPQESQSPKVLVVEDEEPILDGLVELFRTQDFEPIGVADGLAALEKLASSRFDLVILDLMIPRCRASRSSARPGPRATWSPCWC